MLNFTLVQRKEMWCAESAAASVAAMFNRHFEMMFSESWSFFLPKNLIEHIN